MEGRRQSRSQGARRRKPQRSRSSKRRQRSDIGRRVVTGVPWAAFAIVMVAAGGIVYLVAMIGFALLALHEFYRLTRSLRPVVLAGFLVAIGLALAAYFGSQYQMVLVMAVGVAVTFVLLLARPSRHDATVSMAVTMFGVLWIGVSIAHAVLLRKMPHGGGLVIDILVATFVADTFAYFGGKLYGRTPLAPRLSPNKTVEGLIAGVAGGTLGFWLAGLYQDWLGGTDALIIGVVVAAVAPLGDIFESAVKRDLEVKDSGRFFGAHGGVLDRLDAAFFALVAGYYMAQGILGA